MQYTGVPPINNQLSFVPFAFYDIGKVWNLDQNSAPISAASIGLGTYYQFKDRLNGSFNVAFPLTKDIDTPIEGGADGPRVSCEINAHF